MSKTIKNPLKVIYTATTLTTVWYLYVYVTNFRLEDIPNRAPFASHLRAKIHTHTRGQKTLE